MSSNLGDYIRERRIQLGLKQTDLADLAGIPRTTANRIETGVTKLPEAVARRGIAKALGIHHVDLLIAAGELSRDEVEYQTPDDSPTVSALRPILDSQEFSEDELRALMFHVRSAIDLIKGNY